MAYEQPTSRREVSRQLFGKECDCEVCNWEDWPRDLADRKAVVDILRKYKDSNPLKMRQLAWAAQTQDENFLVDVDRDHIPGFLAEFVACTENDPKWHEIVLIARLYPNPKTDTQFMLSNTIHLSIKKLLRLNQTSPDPIIKSLI